VSGRLLAFELRVVPFEEPARPSHRAAVGLFLDMTRIDSAESMRRRFVGDVSHELRTPITAIKAAAESLTRSGEVPPHLFRFPEIVVEQSLRMEALVDDLTDLSLIETGAVTLDWERCRLGEVAGEVFRSLAHKAERGGVTLDSEVPPDFLVYADRRRLAQILVNLVDNAVKFSSNGNAVAVKAGIENGATWIEVVDHGLGIPPGEQEKIFQRFYQSDRSRSKVRPGTGLGLAIVKHLMILHGGRVELRSTLGTGSVFRLEFPVEERIAETPS